MIQKFLITLILILLAWFGFKWFYRIRQINEERKLGVVKDKKQSDMSSNIEDMVQCPNCGAFVPNNGKHKCG